MAWSEPRTWADGILSASALSTELKGNFNETAPALAQAKGDLFVGLRKNKIARLPVGADDLVLQVDEDEELLLKWATLDRSQSIFVKALVGNGSGGDGGTTEASFWSRFGGSTLTANTDQMAFTMMMPSYATTVQAVTVYVMPEDGSQFVADVDSNYAADQEQTSGNFVSANDVVYSVVPSQWNPLDVTAKFSGATGGDVLGITFNWKTATDVTVLHVLGAQLRFS